MLAGCVVPTCTRACVQLDPQLITPVLTNDRACALCSVGPAASLFSGYAWSLDTFTDYTWQDLTKLSMVIIILLIVEVCSGQQKLSVIIIQPLALTATEGQ
jgi:hypothetical protein